MVNFNNACIAAVAAVSFSATTSIAQDFTRITSKADFTKVAVNKKLVANWGWVRSGSDGRVTGVSDGDSISGTWTWQGRNYCRDITFGSTRTGFGCIAVYVSGDNIVYIMDKGQGQQVPMKIR